MKVLVIGSGAREHAIADALLRGGSVEEVTVAPGNPGMELEDGIRTLQLAPSNQAALIDFVRNNDYDWVFVGPEVPLIDGIVDAFAEGRTSRTGSPSSTSQAAVTASAAAAMAGAVLRGSGSSRIRPFSP